jgi:hypothetical protein
MLALALAHDDQLVYRANIARIVYVALHQFIMVPVIHRELWWPQALRASPARATVVALHRGSNHATKKSLWCAAEHLFFAFSDQTVAVLADAAEDEFTLKPPQSRRDDVVALASSNINAFLAVNA